ncbi:uncharacterized protein LOC129585986 isoform X2 [Paramacrobiotus metropolitanus]|uniref:uncharacterized protein LOC129585986 isoform X2 n=1 Tax=Paramacrobiotus metropolitanus TaxID=2943436 RepID=UPI002445A792|nr:uncharacterized protein LOC129585986 isoform X2 [Paramacrobiotus metropolitanus]
MGFVEDTSKGFLVYLDVSSIRDHIVNAMTFKYKDQTKHSNLTEYIKLRICACSFDPDTQKFETLHKRIAELHAAAEQLFESNKKLRFTLGISEPVLSPSAAGNIDSVPSKSPADGAKPQNKLTGEQDTDTDNTGKHSSKGKKKKVGG